MIYKSKCRNACDVNVYIEFIEAIECWIRKRGKHVFPFVYFLEKVKIQYSSSKDSPAMIERERWYKVI